MANNKEDKIPLTHFTVAAVFVIILIVLVNCSNNYSLPKDIYVRAEQDVSVEHTSYFSSMEDLRFLGMIGEKKLWVEDKSGQRGIMPFYEGSLRVMSGQKLEDLKDYRLSERNGYCFTSLNYIKKYCVGRTLPEIEKKYCPAIRVFASPFNSSDTQADFLKIAALDENGDFYNVNMLFDEHGKCKMVFTGTKLLRRNGSVLAKLPLATTIAGWNWVMCNVQEDLYKSNHDDWAWYWRWAYNIVWFILIYVLWAILPILIPLILITGLAKFDFMRFIPSWGVVLIGLVSSAVLGHLWVVAILCWGYMWWFHLPLTIGVAILLALLTWGVLDGEDWDVIPSTCPHCGRRESYVLIRRENLKRYKAVRRETERIGSIQYRDSNSEHTTTYTYDRYFNGKFDGTEKYKITTYSKCAKSEFREWEVSYNVTESDNIYCCKCGAKIVLKGEKSMVETGRKELRTYKQMEPLEGTFTDGKLPEDKGGFKYYQKRID